MKRIRPIVRFSAVLLLVLTLHLLAYGFVLPKFELSSLQMHVDSSASLISADAEEHARVRDFKPPKHSFIDYSTFFSPKKLSLSYNPYVSQLPVYEQLQALPQVYLEINVPPDSLSSPTLKYPTSTASPLRIGTCS